VSLSGSTTAVFFEPNEWVAFAFFHHVNRRSVFGGFLAATAPPLQVSCLSAVASALDGAGDGAKWGAV
jgi:hypothetical protein